MIKQKALFVLSSATKLVFSTPANQSVSVGFFLSEMGQIARRFENQYDYIFATPDGKKPTLDINGEALVMQSGDKLMGTYIKTSLEQLSSHFDAEKFRQKYPQLVQRRQEDLDFLARHMGKLPISEPLPRTDKEAKAFYPELKAWMEQLEDKTIHSLDEILAWDSDENNDFKIADLAFVHLPGGHAPMVDFSDSPQIGELLHRTHQNKVLVSLICHAPVALASARLSIDKNGEVIESSNFPYQGATVTTFPKIAENLSLDTGYLHVPHHKTRLQHYADTILKNHGYNVVGPLNFTAPHIEYVQELNLLTGNGPQSVDIQTNKIAEILAKKQ